MTVAFYVASALLIVAVAVINWLAKAPPARMAPLVRWGVMIGLGLVAALSTWVIVWTVESGAV
ncbi:hypothetical protein [Blastococcus xanthinilyticus]|uniref:Uncharacterized protein n=1 Tax=Blastococcus xanthinilyticus TaxID=1564164 RepID=A0A5S5CMU2_9ACTN|nr:hypothetical protein [Blastococcus xanthinilyticus]TYP81214.1 hypothetical protein BD833_12520 [Blastococcus xanthinilyticus]